jgi:hypothetical protein
MNEKAQVKTPAPFLINFGYFIPVNGQAKPGRLQ